MQTWIALFRGVNVGGNNILPMAELREDLAAMSLKNVRTYIQSGNLVFDVPPEVTAPLDLVIPDHIEKRHGFRPQLLLLTRKQLVQAVERNPFPEAVEDPKTLHFLFLAETATSPDMEALEAKKGTSEEYHLTERVFYLHAPEGIGRSKLAASAERHLGVLGTGRNYRTVGKLLAMSAPD
ncbi:MAG: DUF1697 domain-containing protein [Planctomycetota bacterium]